MHQTLKVTNPFICPYLRRAWAPARRSPWPGAPPASGRILQRAAGLAYRKMNKRQSERKGAREREGQRYTERNRETESNKESQRETVSTRETERKYYKENYHLLIL